MCLCVIKNVSIHLIVGAFDWVHCLSHIPKAVQSYSGLLDDYSSLQMDRFLSLFLKFFKKIFFILSENGLKNKKERRVGLTVFVVS